MKQHCLIIVLIVIGAHIDSSLCQSDNLNLNLCRLNKTISVQISGNPNDMNCVCQFGQPADQSLIRDDFIHIPGIGSYKFHKQARIWSDARRKCHEENAHLVIINSKAEEAALLDIFRREKNGIRDGYKEQIYLGIHDQFNEGEWLTIFDEPLATTGYAEWSKDWYGLQPDNNEGNQNCGALVSPGGMDDVKCSEKFGFFCELPISC